MTSERTLANGPIYDNVGVWAAGQGFLGAVMSYRLAPQHGWPTGALDVDAAIAWLRANGVRLGGRADCITVLAHSAGAAHAAAWVGNADLQQRGAPAQAAILVSGVYTIDRPELAQIASAYYGTDAGHYAERSSLPRRTATPVPLLVASAELDPPLFERQALDLLSAAHQAWGVLPSFVRLQGHSHYSEIFALDAPYRPRLAAAIRDFLHDVPGIL